MRTHTICLALATVLICPFAFAQWVQTNEPYGGGEVTCFAVSGTNLFAGSGTDFGGVGGVFLSTNNGTSWTTTGLTSHYVYALAVSGTNIFAGTAYGIFLSVNNGISWTAVDSGLTDHYVLALAVFGPNLFAGTTSGVFLSTNSGASWTATGTLNRNVHALAMSDTNLFAATDMDVYLSTNNGVSWTPTGLTNAFVYALVVSGRNLFAGTWENGVFLSTNNGANWTEVNSGVPKNPYDTAHYACVDAFEVIGTNILAGTGRGVYRSTDDGESWSATDSDLTSTRVFALAVSGTNLFAGTGGAGVFLSTDNGSSWTPANYGFVRADVNSLATSGTNLFAGTSIGVFHSTNDGIRWTSVSNGLMYIEVSAFGISGTNVYAATRSNGIFLSTNDGTSWSAVKTGLPKSANNVDYDPVNALVVNGTNLFAGTASHGVFLSTNNGTSWTQTAMTNLSVNALAFSGTNLFAGTLVYGVLLSTNNGTSWTQTGLTNNYVYAFAVSGTNLFAETYGGVYLSSDNGTSWTPTSLRNHDVHAFAVSGTNLFAGSYGEGVFVSTDNGASWESTGLTTNGVSALTVADENLFAGTRGGGVFRRPLFEMAKSPPHPFITSISDVPDDEGGEVLLTWSASSLDTNSTTLAYYSIWRSVSRATNTVNTAQRIASTTTYSERPQNRRTMFNGREYNWEWIAAVAAHQSATYSYTAPTVSDSMSTTNGMQSFLVLAQTNNPSVFYYSNIDSGYSVDNLAPMAPRNLDYNLYADAVFLRWDPNAESDFNRYAIYRSAHPIANPSLLQPYAYSRDWVFVDSTALHRGYYRIRAQDIHENYSLPSNQVRVIGAGPLRPQWIETSLDSVGACCFAENGANLFAGTSKGVFRSFDGDTNWTAVNASLTDTVVNGLVCSGTNLFAVTNSGVFVSNDNGGSWTQTGLIGSGVTSIAASGTNLYAGSYGGVVRSTDGGTNWIQVDSGLTCKVVNSLAVSPDGSGRTNLLAGTGTCYWKFGCQGGVFLLSDNATIWTSLGLSSKAVMSLAVVPQGTGGTYFLAALLTGEMLRNTGNDTIWTSADSGLGDLRVSCFAVSDKNIFAGTYFGGVFLSTNSGTSWASVNTGLSDTSVTALAVSGPSLFAGSSAGVWRRPLSDLATVLPTASHEMPHSFGLDQNYPNPFNPATTISYELPIASQVSLTVYDILGRKVSVLVNERRNAGVHEVKFDGSNLASGVYLYRLTAGQYIECRKMVLMK